MAERGDVLRMVGHMLAGRLANATLDPVVSDREMAGLVERAIFVVEAVDGRLRTAQKPIRLPPKTDG